MRDSKEVRNKAQAAPSANPIVHTGSGVKNVTLDFSKLDPKVIQAIDNQLREYYAMKKAAQNEYRRIKAEAGPRHGPTVEVDVVYRRSADHGHVTDANQPDKRKAPQSVPWTA